MARWEVADPSLVPVRLMDDMRGVCFGFDDSMIPFCISNRYEPLIYVKQYCKRNKGHISAEEY